MSRFVRLLFVLAISLFISSNLYAATIVVEHELVAENLGDGKCSLMEAFKESVTTGASNGDCVAGSSGNGKAGEDIIELASQSHYIIETPYLGEHGLPPLSQQVLTLNGNGSIIARAQAEETPLFRFFQVGASSTLYVKDLILVGGKTASSYGGGAVVVGMNARLFLDGCTLHDNESWFGGAISALNGAKVLILNSVLYKNIANSGHEFYAQGGGAIFVQGGDLDVVNSTIAANTSIGKSGAGIKNMGSNIEILNSVISLNARDNRSS